MCGISLLLNHDAELQQELAHLFPITEQQKQQQQLQVSVQQLCQVIQPRGPDATKIHTMKICEKNITCMGTLLSLRGEQVAQPLIFNEHVLVWNGEVFGGALYEQVIRAKKKYSTFCKICASNGNDSEAVLKLFASCTSAEQVLHELATQIQGPYAFVYINVRRMLFVTLQKDKTRIHALWQGPIR